MSLDAQAVHVSSVLFFGTEDLLWRVCMVGQVLSL